jgi:hypothetical protein
MQAITYKNTKTTVGNWIPPLHESQPRGYAHETDKHFVHYYGVDHGLWWISPGITVTQAKSGDLEDWLRQTFGAEDLVRSEHLVGQTTTGIWRPGIWSYDDIRQGLSTTDKERHAALQATRLLLDRLDELVVYVEPTRTSLHTYGHKTRELLILACTEVENAWKYYMRLAHQSPSRGRDFTTKDYVRLLRPLHLSEFELILKPYDIDPIRPFATWDAAYPTRSLTWYDAYNSTKHDRQTHFDKATLKNCIDAVCAYLVMFSVRFSPLPLSNEGGPATALFNQLFDITLRNCTSASFYVPLIELPENIRSEAIWFNSTTSKYLRPWSVQPFTL